jgi:hypothetical protein
MLLYPFKREGSAGVTGLAAGGRSGVGRCREPCKLVAGPRANCVAQFIE